MSIEGIFLCGFHAPGLQEGTAKMSCPLFQSKVLILLYHGESARSNWMMYRNIQYPYQNVISANA